MSDIDWDNPFKPEDFEESAKVIAMKRAGLYGLLNWRQMSEVANTRFRELIKEHGKKVYSNKDSVILRDWHHGMLLEDTHLARLVDVKEIK